MSGKCDFKVQLLLVVLVLLRLHSLAQASDIVGEEERRGFMEAIDRNDAGAVRAYIAGGMSLNELYRFGETPLTGACQASSPAIVQMLLAAGADPNLGDGSFTKPILLAFKNPQYREVVRLLADAGADLSVEDRDFNTPVSRSLDKHIHDDPEGGLETLTFLLSRGAYADTPDYRGYTPLMRACEKGAKALVELFLVHGANPNWQTKDGVYVIQVAGTEEIRAILKEHGAIVK